MAKNIIELLMGRKPDKYVTNEAGDTTGFEYSGTVPGGIPGLIGEMFGRGSQEPEFQGPPVPPDYQYTPPVNEKPSDNPLNPLNQKVNEVSTMENTNNYNQTSAAKTQDSPYQTMLKDISGHYGKESHNVEDLMNRISFHETGHDQRYDPGARQVASGGGEGVGRGLFQFEQRMIAKDESGKPILDEAGNKIYVQAGGLTARNRLAEYFKEKGQEIPSWLSQKGMDDPSIGFDASQLTPDQQKMLFLGNIRMGRGRNLEGMENTADWWSTHHHIGGGRGGEFEDSMRYYQSPEEIEMMNEVTNPAYQQAF